MNAKFVSHLQGGTSKSAGPSFPHGPRAGARTGARTGAWAGAGGRVLLEALRALAGRGWYAGLHWAGSGPCRGLRRAWRGIGQMVRVGGLSVSFFESLFPVSLLPGRESVPVIQPT